MFDYYECQAVTVVHRVSVQSSACKSFEAGLYCSLTALSGVRLWSETEITASSSVSNILAEQQPVGR